jgi:hypothetical protein
MKLLTDVTIDQYHASEFVSHSKLRTFADVGAFGYHGRYLSANAPKPETSDAMRFGQAFETYLQEPKVFSERYKEAPALEGKADDALLAEALAAGVLNDDGKPFTKRHNASTVHLAMMRAQGGDVMTRADMVRIERMAESFAKNPDARLAIAGMDTQVTLRSVGGGFDALPGLQARPDWYGVGSGASVDLKSVAQFGDFDRTIVSSGYHTQAALIDVIAGVRNPRTLIACENVWPFRCQVIELPHELLEAGAAWCRERIAELRMCYEQDSWPLCETRRTAGVPRWMTNKGEW